MVRSGTPDGAGDQRSLGDLVALATKDISQLLHYEITLAKSELRMDAKRVAVSGALAGFGAVVVALIMFVLCFAYAYGLYAVGAPGGLWGAFLWVALTLAVLFVAACGIAFLVARRVTGMRMTRRTIHDDLGMLRRAETSPDGSGPAVTNPKSAAAVSKPAGSAAGSTAEIPARQ